MNDSNASFNCVFAREWVFFTQLARKSKTETKKSIDASGCQQDKNNQRNEQIDARRDSSIQSATVSTTTTREESAEKNEKSKNLCLCAARCVANETPQQFETQATEKLHATKHNVCCLHSWIDACRF
jgi:hypothetical protein